MASVENVRCGIKSMYVDSSAIVGVKGSESEWFRIDGRVRQGCTMSPWPFNAYLDGVMKEVKMGMGRRGVRFLEDGREWGLPGLLYADDLVLCGESDLDLRVMVGQFNVVCRRRELKVYASKSKVMECEVRVDEIRLDHVSEFKYLGCVLDQTDTDGVECSRKVARGKRATDAIKSLVNARDLPLECARVLHETLFEAVLMYGSETML